jgi:hypothetical protein
MPKAGEGFSFFGLGSTNMPRRRRWGRTPPSKSFCVGRLGHLVFEFKPMANVEIYPAKLAEWATASHVEKHTPVPRPPKTAATPAN